MVFHFLTVPVMGVYMMNARRLYLFGRQRGALECRGVADNVSHHIATCALVHVRYVTRKLSCFFVNMQGGGDAMGGACHLCMRQY